MLQLHGSRTARLVEPASAGDTNFRELRRNSNETLRLGIPIPFAAHANTGAQRGCYVAVNGIGSDAFAILWDGSKLHGLNASGRSPEGWTIDRFNGKTAMPTRGWDAVTIPGAVSAWVALSERFGKLPFANLFVPAIRYAADGYLVSPTIARLWARQVPNLKDVPGFAEHFMPHGRAPKAGEKFTAPAHARALARIAQTKGAAFYLGELAESMAAHSRAHGGAMTMSDLAAHTVDWVEPLAQDYRGYTLHEIPPNGQGIAGSDGARYT